MARGVIPYASIYYSKKNTVRRDSGLSDYSDEEISKKPMIDLFHQKREEDL